MQETQGVPQGGAAGQDCQAEEAARVSTTWLSAKWFEEESSLLKFGLKVKVESIMTSDFFKHPHQPKIVVCKYNENQ